ncbi:hypothetical protein [Deinococcus multiflagellatus]|uniref:Uncharacterized protein n=1 Tax=Deinococcus multiflagellatus TaxID=1656887 RepID=A0ABW1ZNU8_9DEIO|nr:hypothetical protein [Deinococcus multiflagellatus]MBZ9714925.1 hypothetical protein [Deinococcus multiflagellatus]
MRPAHPTCLRVSELLSSPFDQVLVTAQLFAPDGALLCPGLTYLLVRRRGLWQVQVWHPTDPAPQTRLPTYRLHLSAHDLRRAHLRRAHPQPGWLPWGRAGALLLVGTFAAAQGTASHGGLDAEVLLSGLAAMLLVAWPVRPFCPRTFVGRLQVSPWSADAYGVLSD